MRGTSFLGVVIPLPSRRQSLVEFIHHTIHLVSKKLVHLTQAALGVKGGHLQVVSLDVKRADYMVADHVQPGHLLFVEFLSRAAVALHNPFLEIPAHGLGIARDDGIYAAGAADER